MDFKNLLSQLDQLNEAAKKSKVKEDRPEPDDEDYDAADEADRADDERRSREEDGLAEGIMDEPATKETPTGRVHKAKPGGYGRKDDEDDSGKKVKADAPKKGRGRPKKDADETGEVKKYDWSAFGASKKDVKLPKWDKSKTTKHTLKDWVEHIESKYIAESEQVTEAAKWRTHPDAHYHDYEYDSPRYGEKRPMGDFSDTPDELQGRTFNDIENGKPSKQHIEYRKRYIKPSLGKHGPKGPLPEAEQIQIKPASQVRPQPGQSSVKPGQQQQSVQPQQNTQVIQQGNKTLGTVNNPQLAQQIKQSIGKGEMTLNPDQEMAEGEHTQHAFVGGKPNVPNKAAPGQQPKTSWKRDPITALTNKIYDKFAKTKQVSEGDIPSDQVDMGAGLGRGRSNTTLEGKDEGKPGKNFAKIAKSAGEKYGSKAAGERVAGAVRNKLAKQGKLEEAKPDFLDLDKDGDKKESMKKAAKDKKSVKEAAEHRLKAAHHRGKAHALAKENYNCKYDDMEEARMYHQGFKEGLDECYGQVPIQGMVGEANPSVVDDMASFGAHTPEVEEGNAFTAKLASTPSGGKFSLGGKTFTDKSRYNADIDEMTQSIAFESWDKQLNAILTEGEKVEEGMTISISKGQQGAPDTVSVTADSAEADQVLAAIKQAGLGLFGGDEGPKASSPMSLQIDGEPDETGASGAEIGVVDDHDDMMSLIKKMTGGEITSSGSSEDYADEEGHDHEDVCSDCGSAECQCDHDEESADDSEEVVDEVESYDQEEEEVAEDNPPDSDAEETTADENAEAAEDEAAAEEDEAEDEETVEESSYANGDDDQYEADINFMTKAISGGLNKEKATGQTTIPVVANQGQRVGVSEDSLTAWKKLAGI